MHLLRLGVASRQHEHARSLIRPARPQRAAQRDAVHAGKHDVQHHQIEPIGAQAIQRRVSIRDLFGLEPRQRQMESDDLPDRRFIFDDQRSPGGFRVARTMPAIIANKVPLRCQGFPTFRCHCAIRHIASETASVSP